MDASRLMECWSADLEGRPWRFLVSTAAATSDPRKTIGASDYSYRFVRDALAPVFESAGAWITVDRPESSLIYQAARAVEEGFRPLHLTIAPLHCIYLTPSVPTVAFPFWEFPRVPDRDFGYETRNNWARIVRKLDGVLAACNFTADAIRRAGATCPVSVVPVPVEPADFELADWNPARKVSIQCRHIVWSDEPGPVPVEEALPERPLQGKERLERYLRVRYKRHIRPMLSERAMARVTHYRNLAMRRAEVAMRRVAVSRLDLSGIVYTSIFNLGDPRKNPRDLLSAFLWAFRDEPRATLVLKLATRPETELAELERLRALYGELGMRHRCRLAVITDYLDDDQMRDLFRATTYYVNTSHGEGACLPLQRSLASGRPGLAPAHSAMADYFDASVGFVIRSHAEPTHWPHDPERRIETTRQRLVWADIEAGYRRSFEIASDHPSQYERLATAARARLTATNSKETAARAFSNALAQLSVDSVGALAWSA